MALELHFYPAQYLPTGIHSETGAAFSPGLLLLKDGNVVLYRTKAYGGPSKVIKVQGQPSYSPTPAGRFVLLEPERYSTATWKFSEIEWGTPLQDKTALNDVWYLVSRKQGNEVWGSVKKDFGITRAEIMEYHHRLYSARIVPKTWVFNAFGPMAFRFYRDKNRNRRRDESEGIEGAMFHTTAENEAEAARRQPLQMTNSHGCIHLQPNDRAALIGLGGLKAGITLVIHGYDERS